MAELSPLLDSPSVFGRLPDPTPGMAIVPDRRVKRSRQYVDRCWFWKPIRHGWQQWC
jgi:hypothetical protein